MLAVAGLLPENNRGFNIINKDEFAGFHPIINFMYFAMVLIFTMFFMHPAYLIISLISAIAYSIYLNGLKAVRFNLLYMLPMLLIAALVNPAFNHEGASILAYLPSGNPLTLESIYYGLGAAAMLVAVIIWFSCYNAVMTSDKFVYLFGRIIPAMSLVLSMTLRFVPKFKAQLRVVSEAQRCVGRDVSNGNMIERIKHAVTIISIMITWALESAIESADSMKSRGYGLPGRSAFSIYRFDDRDKSALLWLCFCGVYIVSAWAVGGTYFRYYPTIKAAKFSTFGFSFMLVYLLLCLTPLIINIYADHKWKKLSGGAA